MAAARRIHPDHGSFVTAAFGEDGPGSSFPSGAGWCCARRSLSAFSKRWPARSLPAMPGSARAPERPLVGEFGRTARRVGCRRGSGGALIRRRDFLARTAQTAAALTVPATAAGSASGGHAGTQSRRVNCADDMAVSGESRLPGHPDKLADLIADALIDSMQDAVPTFGPRGSVSLRVRRSHRRCGSGRLRLRSTSGGARGHDPATAL
jgi:hypothetical protein